MKAVPRLLKLLIIDLMKLLHFTCIPIVETMEKRDYMPPFFFAETLKYLYLTFSNGKITSISMIMFSIPRHILSKEVISTGKRSEYGWVSNNHKTNLLVKSYSELLSIDFN